MLRCNLARMTSANREVYHMKKIGQFRPPNKFVNWWNSQCRTCQKAVTQTRVDKRLWSRKTKQDRWQRTRMLDCFHSFSRGDADRPPCWVEHFNGDCIEVMRIDTFVMSHQALADVCNLTAPCPCCDVTPSDGYACKSAARSQLQIQWRNCLWSARPLG